MRRPARSLALGCVIEPGFDRSNRAHELVFGLARALDGMVFISGAVVDAKGVALATPRPDENEVRQPPTPERALRRAYCLSAIALRGIVEGEPGPDAQSLVDRARAWLAEHGLDDELEEQERELLATPVGKASPQAAADASWRSEGLAVLAWALGASEMPAHDAQIDPAAVSNALGFLGTPFGAPALRAAAEVERLRRRLLGIHWRMREHSLRSKVVDFVAFSKKNWFGGFDIDGIAVAGNDLATQGCRSPRLPPAPRAVP